jgi:hypothetical protein
VKSKDEKPIPLIAASCSNPQEEMEATQELAAL